MIMHVCGAVVIRALSVFVVLLVRVNQRRMAVLVLMVVGSMCEFAQRAARMVVRHVIVVVRVKVAGMRMLLFAHHRLVLRHAGILIHGWVPRLSALPVTRPMH
jgi:hypothetical protein